MQNDQEKQPTLVEILKDKMTITRQDVYGDGKNDEQDENTDAKSIVDEIIEETEADEPSPSLKAV